MTQKTRFEAIRAANLSIPFMQRKLLVAHNAALKTPRGLPPGPTAPPTAASPSPCHPAGLGNGQRAQAGSL